jgi:5-methylcytosine-specific restriction endonuclease McrA
MTALPSAEIQLKFLSQVQRLFDEGEFTATYKFALLTAITELSVEKGQDSGEPLHLPLKSIAEKFIELYWKQIKPYKSFDNDDNPIIIQNLGKQVAVSKLVGNLQVNCKSLFEAKRSNEWSATLNHIGRIIVEMPLWKIQTLRRQKVIFLFNETLVNDGIELLPGVAYCLRQFNPFILSLTRAAWVRHIKSNPLNRMFFGTETDLEEFLFGTERSSLLAVRGLLVEIQSNHCFYCNGSIHNNGAVDHFIPWSRYPRDITQNFVLAHGYCNRDKSDLLAATKHLESWRNRNERFRSSLEQFNMATILNDDATCMSVARWAYGHAYSTNSQSWLAKGLTEPLTMAFADILA